VQVYTVMLTYEGWNADNETSYELTVVAEDSGYAVAKATGRIQLADVTVGNCIYSEVSPVRDPELAYVLQCDRLKG